MDSSINLILNARDVMPDGGVLTITTRYDDEARRKELKVCDTGSGISEECLPNINDPFFTTKPVGFGSGMVLAVVDAIVRAHNGEIKISSVTGKGTCLEMDFALVSVDDVSPDELWLHHGRYDDSGGF